MLSVPFVPSVDLIRPNVATMEPYTPIFPLDVLAARLGRTPDDIIRPTCATYTSTPTRRAAPCGRPWPTLPASPPAF